MRLSCDFREEILNIEPYVPGKPIEEVKRELGIKEVIKLSSNENPLGPPPSVIKGLQESLKGVHIYPDGNCFDLRRELSSKLGVKDKEIIFGNGSDEIIKLLAETFLKPGDEVLTGNPTFSEYAFAANLMGGKMVRVPLKDHTFSLEDIADNITSKTKLIFICNPNNPTGTHVSAQEMKNFLEKVPESVIVVFDEAYVEYVEADDFPDTIRYIKEGKKNMITLRTFSKIYGIAGLRIGYGVASEDLLDLIERTREPFNVNSLAQAAALTALKDEDYVSLSREVNSRGKEFLYSKFDDLGLNYISTSANFIMLDTGKNSRELFKRMLEKGIIVRTGDVFGMDTFIRVTIGTEEQNEKFISALRETLSEL